MPKKNQLILGIGSHVVSIDSASGEETWRTKIKSGQFASLQVRGDRIYAGTGGELFCLDRTLGSILWHNKLKRLGYGVICFAGPGGGKSVDDLVIGIGRYVVRLDATIGKELWRTKLKSSQVVTLLGEGNRVYAGAGGELFCLERESGQILWENGLKGLGYSLISFGGTDSTGAAAQAMAAQAAAAAGAAAATTASTT